jgi:hypothetical protein
MIGIIDDLAEWCDGRGIKRVAELTGAVRDHELETDTYAAAAAGI